MSWWKRLRGGGAPPSSPKCLDAVRLDMPGWTEEANGGDFRVWRDSSSDVLSLSIMDASLDLSEISNEAALQHWSRELAESRDAGLIEVRAARVHLGPAGSLIYKRLEERAFIFTGMLFIPTAEGSLVWTIVAGERGTTGVREAVITAELMNAGKLTIQEYERSWAQDPYEPTYRGKDRRVLRFVSDSDCYDERFPDHPLSKVRRVLAALPNAVRIESPARESWNAWADQV